MDYKYSYKNDNHFKITLERTWILHIFVIALDYLTFGPKYVVWLR